MSNQLARKPYPSDITDAQWAILAPHLPEPPTYSPREPIEQRELVNGMMYVLRTGCSWRQMPHDLPSGAFRHEKCYPRVSFSDRNT